MYKEKRVILKLVDGTEVHHVVPVELAVFLSNAELVELTQIFLTLNLMEGEPFVAIGDEVVNAMFVTNVYIQERWIG